MSDWGNEYPDVIQIVADRLVGVLSAVGAAAFIGEIPNDQDAPRTTGGQLRPYVVVEFSAPSDVPANEWGISGVADQMGMFSGAALCVSESYMNTLRLVGLVANTLRGFRPTPDCTEIEIYGGSVVAPVDALQRPSRYALPIGFGMSIGATVVP